MGEVLPIIFSGIGSLFMAIFLLWLNALNGKIKDHDTEMEDIMNRMNANALDAAKTYCTKEDNKLSYDRLYQSIRDLTVKIDQLPNKLRNQ